METIVKHKYAVGSKVYYRDFDFEILKEDCNVCNGHGVLTRKDNVDINCPSCGGRKFGLSSKRQIETVKSGIVNYINVELKKNGDIIIVYYLDNLDPFNESRLFGSPEDVKKTVKPEILNAIGWHEYATPATSRYVRNQYWED